MKTWKITNQLSLPHRILENHNQILTAHQLNAKKEFRRKISYIQARQVIIGSSRKM